MLQQALYVPGSTRGEPTSLGAAGHPRPAPIMSPQQADEELEKAKDEMEHSSAAPEKEVAERELRKLTESETSKAELEKAKLQMRTLQEKIRELERLKSPSSRNLRGLPEKTVPTESPRSITQSSELEKARREADHLKLRLRAKEDELRVALTEVERLRAEAEESAAEWTAKEEGFVNCLKETEAEAANMAGENRRLLELQREAKEEHAKMRDIMKQALNEANVAKTGLEVCRRENTKLKTLLSEKEQSLTTFGEEAPPAADGAAKELNGADIGSMEGAEAGAGKERTAAKVPAEHRRSYALAPPSSSRPNGSRGPAQARRSASFHGLKTAAAAAQGPLGCVSDMTVPSLRRGLGSFRGFGSGRLRRAEERGYAGDPGGAKRGAAPENQRRNQILHRFEELVRRRRSVQNNYERVTGAGAPAS